MNRTEAARLAGFKWPSRVAYQLEQSPKIIARIRNERNKLYQTELASQSVETLRDVMSDPEAPASARVAAARTALELAGDIGKHSQANQRMDDPGRAGCLHRALGRRAGENGQGRHSTVLSGGRGC